MNKIISANINGFVFNIDEKAYEKLKNYLERIKENVKNDEVMMDIENRIAELFDYRLKNGSQAIFDRDVEDIIQQIGSPEQFGQEELENGKESKKESNYSERRKYRRLYRNEDDKVIGGVCSGIASYFGIDPLFLRIGFAVSLFAFGTGILLYIFLMIVLPVAATPAEKLEMMGEPVDFNNLSKTIEKDFKDAYNRYQPEVKTGFERFLEILVRVGAVVLIIFLISLFVPVSIGIFTSVGVASWFLPIINSYMFLSPNEGIIILIGLILFFVVPLIGAGYKLVRVVFKTKPMNKVLSILLSIFWFIGFCLLSYSTYNIGQEFSSSSSIVQTDTIDVAQGGTIVIRARNTEGKQRFIINDRDGDEKISIHSREDFKDFLDDRIGRNIELKIVKGYASKPVITVIKRSNGRNRLLAGEYSNKIGYNYQKSDSSVLFDDYFTTGSDQLWRNQKIRIIIEIPKNFKFVIDGSCSGIMNDRHFDDYDDYEEGSIFNKQLHIDEQGKIVN